MSNPATPTPSPDEAPDAGRFDAALVEQVLSQAIEPHAIVDRAGRFRWVNAAFCELLAYSPEELVRMSVGDVVEGFQPDRLEQMLARDATVRQAPFEVPHRRKDGTLLPIEVQLTLVVLPDGKFLLSSLRDISARKVEEASRESSLTMERNARALIQSILGNISDAFFALDRELRFIYVNPRAEAVLGMTSDQMIGRSVWELFPEAQGSAFDAAFATAMESGAAQTVEAFYPPFDTWFEVRAYPGPIGLTVYFQDVGAKHRAAEALSESEARFRAVQDESPDGFMLFKSVRAPSGDGSPGEIVDFEWVYVNPAAARLVGRPIESFAGKLLLEEMPGNKEDGLFDLYKRVVETGAPAQREFAYRHEGLDHGFRNVAVKVGDGFAVTFSDITARLRAEEALRRSEERYALAARASSHVIWEWDIERNVTTWSDGLATVFGYDFPGNVTPGAWVSDAVHPDDRARINDSMMRVVEAPEQGKWRDTFRMRRADGRYASVESTCYIVRDADGRAVRAVGALEDVTARLELGERLRQAQKMEAVGQLAGGIAHDFNNLLTVITGNLELLQQECARHDTARGELDEIAAAATRARTLVRQLLTFSRKQVVHPTLVHVGEVVKGAEKLLRRVIGEEIVLDVSASDEGASVRVDPSQLEQVVFNLVVNARDALLTPRHGSKGNGGTIIVEVTPMELEATDEGAWGALARGRYVELSVRDTGHGMDAATLERIFEPFFTTKDVGAGTGLGLSTVFGIVRGAGGAIDVESEPGAGTTFRVRLPVAPDESGRAQSMPRSTPPASAAATVLVVEDEAPLRSLLRRILERAGYSVLEARHGGDALLLWNGGHREEIVAVVTDVRMPEMGGPELVRHLYEDRPRLPVLYMSGYSDLANAKALAPNEGFVEKPFTSEQVLQALARLLDDPERRRAAAESP